MSSDFARQQNVKIIGKVRVYRLLTFKNTPMIYNNRQVNRKTVQIKLQLGQHWEKLKSDIIKILESDIVLDIP